MNKYFFAIFSFFILITSAQSNESFDFEYLGQIPILSNGRIKPLDSFARIHLQNFHNKDHLSKTPAIEWFTEVILDPEKSLQRRFFRIINPEVLATLSIVHDQSNNYTPLEIINAFQKNTSLLDGISKTPVEEQTPSQKQIDELYSKLQVYLEISRSFSMLFEGFTVNNAEVAKKLNLPLAQSISYLKIMKQESNLRVVLQDIIGNNRLKNQTTADKEVMLLLNYIDFIRQDEQSGQLKIFPPSNTNDIQWSSPWALFQGEREKFINSEVAFIWSELYRSYLKNDFLGFNSITRKLLNRSIDQSKNLTNSAKMKWEKIFNQLNLFSNAAAFYIISFLFFAASSLCYKKLLEKLSYLSLIVGAIIHGTGISMRCFIMERPPVSSLYESIIFVAFIAVLLSIILELRNKNSLGIFIGSTLGAILLFVSFGYEKDGDSMGMLVAVLDTNFWLATHVVTISIGYGCSLVASLLAHQFLFKKAFSKKAEPFTKLQQQVMLKNIHGTVLFSLFFTILGTILGGIWADQSWGRFWGWDPKENGALFLCLWLLFIVHGKLAGYFKNIAMAIMTGLTSVVVILAWFGVNLLNIGLHSYGFTESIAQNILVFTLAEFFILGFFIIYLKDKKDDLPKIL